MRRPGLATARTAAARPGAPGPAFDWSFLDAAYCISLQGRPDRAGAAAAELHRTGLCARATFLRPKKDPASVRIGIWQSHRRVARHALDHGRATVLICEDDLLFSRRIGPDAVRAVGDAMRALPRDWMVLYLGHWPLWGYFVRPDVLRCGSACCHAYIASERMLRWLCEHPPDSVPIARIAGRGVDAAFARLPATYACSRCSRSSGRAAATTWAPAAGAGGRSSST